MRWCFLTILQLAVNLLFSQPEIPSTFNQQMMLDNSELENVEGTPYLHEEFNTGVIYYGGTHKIEQIPLRLDLFRDRLEFKNEQGAVMAFVNPERMDQVVIGNEVFIYLSKSNANKVSGFLKMWNTRSPFLLTKMDIKFKKGEEAKPFDLHEPRPDRLERIPDKHYIMRDPKEIEKVTSVKKLIRYLGAHNAELTDFAERADISTDEPGKLVKLVNYYLQLEEAGQ
jgi:hypothetical protein